MGLNEESESQGQDIGQATENYINGLDKGEQSSQELSDAEQSMLELESLEKFKYKGKDWTVKDLEKSIMLQSDYTKKSKQLAEERNYYDNLRADLDTVRKNPQMSEEFKKVYPEKFHGYLDYILQKQEQKVEQKPPSNLDPKFLEEFNGIKSEMQQWKEAQMQQQTEAAEAKLISIEESMIAKYPKAPLPWVYANAENLIKSGQVRSNELTPAVWEKIYKDVHEQVDKLSKSEQMTKFNEVKTANKKASDIGRGSSAPGQAPKKVKSISEASEIFIEDLARKK